jgi:hypothetical protein
LQNPGFYQLSVVSKFFAGAFCGLKIVNEIEQLRAATITKPLDLHVQKGLINEDVSTCVHKFFFEYLNLSTYKNFFFQFR